MTPYVTKEMAKSAILKMQRFHEKMRDLYKDFDIDMLKNSGRRNVIMSHAQEKFFAEALSCKFPKAKSDGATGKADIVVPEIYRELEVPTGKKTSLKVKASYHAHGDWQIRVKADGKVIHDQIVGYTAVQSQWLELNLDLSDYAGKKIPIVIENRANDWRNEFGYWGSIKVVSK